jgi:hypothetical protein
MTVMPFPAPQVEVGPNGGWAVSALVLFKFTRVVFSALLIGSSRTSPQAARRGIHQVRRVAGRNSQSERIPGDRISVDELRGSVGRGHGREFVDRHFLRQRVSEQRHQSNGVVGTFDLGNFRCAAFGDQIKHAVAGQLSGVELKGTVAVGFTYLGPTARARRSINLRSMSPTTAMRRLLHS